MPVLEMQACLPSDESAFGAENAEMCRDRLSSAQLAPRMSLVDVVHGLMAIESTSQELFRLTAFPLFLTIGGKKLWLAATAFRLTHYDSTAGYDFHSENTIAGGLSVDPL